MAVKACLLLFSILLRLSVSQDPAPGWLAYAKGVNPAGSEDPITYFEAYWTNLQTPKDQSAACYYAPWYGIETTDNLNLIQPVNAWNDAGSDKWCLMNYYFQWRPQHVTEGRKMYPVPADSLYASVTFHEESQSYMMYSEILTAGHTERTNLTIPVQKEGGEYKKYTIVYVVFEKICHRCDMYPADDIVTYHNISVYYGGKKVSPTWTTGVVDEVCNMTAHIVDELTVSITWNSESDNHPINDPKLIEKYGVGLYKLNSTHY